MPCHDLVAWVQCILPYAFSNVCQVQRAYAMRNQRCLSAAQSNLAADDGRAHIVEVCSAACRAGLQGLTWREVPAPAPQPGRPPLLDAATLIKYAYHKSLEVRPPYSSCLQAGGVCLCSSGRSCYNEAVLQRLLPAKCAATGPRPPSAGRYACSGHGTDTLRRICCRPRAPPRPTPLTSLRFAQRPTQHLRSCQPPTWQRTWRR